MAAIDEHWAFGGGLSVRSGVSVSALVDQVLAPGGIMVEGQDLEDHVDWYRRARRTAIDKEGRLVIPKQL